MTTESRSAPESREPLPENLTHCCDCGSPFSEPVDDWAEYFTELEDAAFACVPCSQREGYPSEFPVVSPEQQEGQNDNL